MLIRTVEQIKKTYNDLCEEVLRMRAEAADWPATNVRCATCGRVWYEPKLATEDWCEPGTCPWCEPSKPEGEKP